MGYTPLFLTGANAKIKVNGLTIAFATDVSYVVNVKHVAPKVLGMYEAYTIEPLAYEVSGQLSVIRYVSEVAKDVVTPVPMDDQGNSIGNWYQKGKMQWVNYFMGNSGRPEDNFSPGTYQNGTFFDIDIFQKRIDKASTAGMGFQNALEDVEAIFRGSMTSKQLRKENVFRVAKLRDCRMTRLDFNMNKRSPGVTRYAFMALYLDEDSFWSIFSGTGQQFA